MARTTDLTTGKLWKNLILFAIPLLLSSLVQQLYNTVDLIFVGNFIDKSASAAIGASSLLITCLVGFFGGMSVGSGVVVSHIFGARDKSGLSRAVHNAMALSLVGGIFLCVGGYFLAPVYLHLVNTPGTLQPMAVSYLRIYLCSLVSMFIYNLGSGVLRAMGDSRSPLYAQAVGGLVNVVMDYLFIRLCSNGINGVAWATLISQTMAAVMVLYFLTRLEPEYRFRLKKLSFDIPILKEVLRVGIPAGAQSLVITLSNVMAQYHINSFGEDSIAAFTAYFKVELIIYLPIVAFGQAIMAFSGQNMGAKKYERMREGTRVCLLMSIITAAVTSMLALVFGRELFRIFNKEESVIAIGCRLIGITFPFYFIYCILQVLGDSLRGAGKVKQPMYIILINICLIRTGLLFLIVPRVNDIRGVAVTYPITWALTAICMSIYYLRVFRSFKQKEKTNGEA
ncbi:MULTISPECIES: MATE family efflux transporter [unclassified Candidatus Paralachnospira]|uniref:MATE family efflux transporter n=1 Tax=unclassified Candidatus Paralachnospira TaxID=3099471 RepID=UPI003F9207DC